MSDLNVNRFDMALLYAAGKHRGHYRKGTTIPYVSHLLQVSGLVLENGGDEDEAIAGLLHDVIEDQDVTPAEIEEKFGPRVKDIVVACSDSVGTEKAPWKQRKLAYVAHIASASKSARLVSSCDKLHNARAILADYRAIGESLWTRFSADRDQILWYYRALADAFRNAETAAESRLLDELNRVVGELESEVRRQS